jgi:Fe-S-cluster containining protein
LEATVTEMMPVAQELFRRGEAYRVLELLSSDGDTGMCVFFVPDSMASFQGHCRYYSWRPTVCRLFGFAARKNKRGKQDAAFCKSQKEWAPALIVAAENALSRGLKAPDYTNFSIRFSALDSELMPINRAIRMALERYGLSVQMAEMQLSKDTVISMEACKDSGLPPHLERSLETPPVNFAA